MSWRSFPLHRFDYEDKRLAFEPVTMSLFEMNNNASGIPTGDVANSQRQLKVIHPHLSETAVKSKRLLTAINKIKSASISGVVNRKNSLSALWLNISHTCNLRCSYCFANCGDYGMAKQQMGKNTAIEAIRFFVRNADTNKALRIVFFGGEPLTNFKAIKAAVKYAEYVSKTHGIKVGFILITNGTLVGREIAAFVKEHNFRIQFSLDGPPHIHDRLRPSCHGNGSFDATYQGLLLVKNAGVTNIAVRSTLTHHNCDVASLHWYMEEIGFSQIGMTPVQANNISDYCLTRSDLAIIKRRYKDLAFAIVNKLREGRATDMGCFSPYLVQLINGQKKRHYCGAGYSSLSVTPEGKLYPCHRLISKSECEIGSIDMSSIVPSGIGAQPVDDKPRCANCWARYLCGGGCEAAAYEKNGDFSKPDEILCKVTKSLAENALRIYYAITTESIEQ